MTWLVILLCVLVFILIWLGCSIFGKLMDIGIQVSHVQHYIAQLRIEADKREKKPPEQETVA